MMGGFDGFGGMGFFGGFGMLLGLLFWIGVIALLVWGVAALFPADRAGGSRNTGSIGSSGSAESALDILKRRYAAGEISQAEFEQARKMVG